VRKRGKASFDPKEFLANVGEGKTIAKYRNDQVVFSQGQVADGNRRHDISFAIGIASMAMWSSSGFERWVYGIGQSRHGRPGKMDTRRGSSVRSDGIVLTMLSSSASGISAICSILTKNITTRLVRPYRCTRTRRSRVPSRLSVARWRCQF
jgi:hypothetical protein